MCHERTSERGRGAGRDTRCRKFCRGAVDAGGGERCRVWRAKWSTCHHSTDTYRRVPQNSLLAYGMTLYMTEECPPAECPPAARSCPRRVSLTKATFACTQNVLLARRNFLCTLLLYCPRAASLRLLFPPPAPRRAYMSCRVAYCMYTRACHLRGSRRTRRAV